MNKPALITCIAGAALLGAFAAKMHSRMAWARTGNPALCSDVPCDHFNARMMAIESILDQKAPEPSYLVIGDSIVEAADLPVICGRKPINAGIGWATVETFHTHARRLADTAKPDFIVVALGTNDGLRQMHQGLGARLSTLLQSLAPWPLVVVPVPPGRSVPAVATINAEIAGLPAVKAAPLPSVENTSDGIHLSTADYVEWKASIVAAAEASACRAPRAAR